MHTLANKISARERETAPKYYYKREEQTTWLQKIKNALRIFLSFMFTQVGVIVLIGLYMVLGAFIFEAIEAESQTGLAERAEWARQNFTLAMWQLTEDHNILNKAEWHEEISSLVLQFQDEVVENVRQGYTGRQPGARLWTFSSSLMYSLTIFTTIGYGNLTTRTALGKVVTILYALVGIPLMFIYMANIGTILATSFKYTYSKMCRCEEEAEELPRKATLPSMPPSPREEYAFSSGETTLRRNSQSTNGGQRATLSPPSMPHLRAPAHLPGASYRATTPLPTNIPTSLSLYSPEMSRRASEMQQQGEEKELETVQFKLVEDIRLVTIPVTTCLLVFVSYILCGAVIFSAWEGWGILDGAYFCFTSLMTIGFGDFVPGNSYIYNVADSTMSEQEANAKIVLGAVYLLLGMAVMSMCINLVQEEIVSQVRLFARSLGLIREFRSADEVE